MSAATVRSHADVTDALRRLDGCLESIGDAATSIRRTSTALVAVRPKEETIYAHLNDAAACLFDALRHVQEAAEAAGISEVLEAEVDAA